MAMSHSWLLLAIVSTVRKLKQSAVNCWIMSSGHQCRLFTQPVKAIGPELMTFWKAEEALASGLLFVLPRESG